MFVFFCYVDMCLMFSWGCFTYVYIYIHMLLTDAWVYFMYFDMITCFLRGTWIGSNDLMTEKERNGMKQDYGKNEKVVLNETFSRTEW